MRPGDRELPDRDDDEHDDPRGSPAPLAVWVYWCRNCGEPILADRESDCDVDCPYCPIGQDEDVTCARYVTPDGTPTASVWQQAAAWEALWETLPEAVGLVGLSGKDAVIAYVSSLRAQVERLTRDRDRLAGYVRAARQLSRDAHKHLLEERPEETARVLYQIMHTLACAVEE